MPVFRTQSYFVNYKHAWTQAPRGMIEPTAILFGVGSMTEVSALEYFNAGMLAYREGNFQQAVDDFLLGLKKDNQSWDMRLYLGMAYSRLGKLREAKQE